MVLFYWNHVMGRLNMTMGRFRWSATGGFRTFAAQITKGYERY